MQKFLAKISIYKKIQPRKIFFISINLNIPYGGEPIKEYEFLDNMSNNRNLPDDEEIQNAVDKIFRNSTLITIAHKIPDLNKYDKIMIMDEGCLIVYDTPYNLLKKDNGIFKQLYECNLKVNE